MSARLTINSKQIFTEGIDNICRLLCTFLHIKGLKIIVILLKKTGTNEKKINFLHGKTTFSNYPHINLQVQLFCD